MPGSKVTKVQIHTKNGRITYELTAAKMRALETVDAAGRVSDAVPFTTARALTRQKMLHLRGSQWFITGLGSQIRRALETQKAAAL